jgi:hypothetical protein
VARAVEQLCSGSGDLAHRPGLAGDGAFDPIDDPYDLRGNPECDERLQPGCEPGVTHVHLVSTTAQVTGRILADIAEDSTAEPCSAFRSPVRPRSVVARG